MDFPNLPVFESATMRFVTWITLTTVGFGGASFLATEWLLPVLHLSEPYGLALAVYLVGGLLFGLILWFSPNPTGTDSSPTAEEKTVVTILQESANDLLGILAAVACMAFFFLTMVKGLHLSNDITWSALLMTASLAFIGVVAAGLTAESPNGRRLQLIRASLIGSLILLASVALPRMFLPS